MALYFDFERVEYLLDDSLLCNDFLCFLQTFVVILFSFFFIEVCGNLVAVVPYIAIFPSLSNT